MKQWTKQEILKEYRDQLLEYGLENEIHELKQLNDGNYMLYGCQYEEAQEAAGWVLEAMIENSNFLNEVVAELEGELN